MKLAIGMVELNSIAKGIETCDYMVKSARVELLRSATTCPGKYLILIGGETGDVKTAVAEGISRGGGNVVDSLLLPNVHPAVIPAVRGKTQPSAYGALGVLETRTVAAAVTAADAAAKAANIVLIRVHIGYAIGGKGYATLTGEVGSVEAAVERAKNSTDRLIGTAVIPHPSKELLKRLA